MLLLLIHSVGTLLQNLTILKESNFGFRCTPLLLIFLTNTICKRSLNTFYIERLLGHIVLLQKISSKRRAS